jgi:hypothetical protein
MLGRPAHWLTIEPKDDQAFLLKKKKEEAERKALAEIGLCFHTCLYAH